tara:strand:+ start:1004 stop:1675 length:672 start_codon:yes stop_codon:yes gene_type:complete
LHLLIAAAGSGRRMGANKNKLLLPLCGKPVLAWTVKAAVEAESIEWIGIVGQSCDESAIRSFLVGFDKPIEWILGGETRQESVEKGLSALPDKASYVLIHDGARCLVEPLLFDRCSEEVIKGDAVIAATPVTDTIKKVDQEGFIVDTPLRKFLWAAQTPQAFSVEQLKQAHQKALENKWEVTDDAALFERLGLPVRILESTPSNIKLTTGFDLIIAESILSKE